MTGTEDNEVLFLWVLAVRVLVLRPPFTP